MSVARLIFLLCIFFCMPARAQVKINEAHAVTIGGIKQWITLNGLSEKPVLLFLHGGPGNSIISYADEFTDRLMNEFIVVHWDQRQSGKTAALNARTTQSLTVSLFVSDAIELMHYLTKRFKKDKIYLAGHSWGGMLALRVAALAPELIQSCIAISPMVHQEESEQRSLAQMEKWASATNNTTALRELATIKIPFAETTDLYLHRKWLAVMAGRKTPARKFVEQWSQTWLPLFQEASAINLFIEAPHYECPVYFLVGTTDFQTHYEVTVNYFEHVTAPNKNLYRIEGAGHSLLSANGKKVQETILLIAQN